MVARTGSKSAIANISRIKLGSLGSHRIFSTFPGPKTGGEREYVPAGSEAVPLPPFLFSDVPSSARFSWAYSRELVGLSRQIFLCRQNECGPVLIPTTPRLEGDFGLGQWDGGRK